MKFSSINILKFVKRNEEPNGSTVYQGFDYRETSAMTLKELFLFFERDIFLETKAKELPKLAYKIIGDEVGRFQRVNVLIEDSEIPFFQKSFLETIGREFDIRDLTPEYQRKNFSKIFTKQGQHTLKKIEQILWRYNRDELPRDGTNYQVRFLYQLIVAREIAQRECEQLNCAIRNTKQRMIG